MTSADYLLLKQKQRVATAIYQVMHQRGISKIQFARMLGTSRTIIDRILSPVHGGVTLDRLVTAAYVLGIPIALRLHSV
jgi:transcriptional regulator with XRE-family HTH domain